MVRTRGGQRVLLQVLASRHSAPPEDVRQHVRAMADRSCPTVTRALAVQREINKALRPYDAFVLSSDLEGLLLDIYGPDDLVAALGPGGEAVIAGNSPTNLLRPTTPASGSHHGLVRRVGRAMQRRPASWSRTCLVSYWSAGSQTRKRRLAPCGRWNAGSRGS